MKKSLTYFARVVVLFVGLAAIAICVILLPELAREEAVGRPAGAQDVTIPFLLGSYVLATPFFVALYQTHKLLTFIDNGKAFSQKSLKALQNIKVCAIIFSLLVILATTLGLIFSKMVDPNEDVTFMVPLGLVFTFVPTVIAVFVAVLQKLISDAMSLKDENDLIV